MTFLLQIYLAFLMAVICLSAPAMIYLMFKAAKGVAFLMRKRNNIVRQIAEISKSSLSVTEMDRLVEMDKGYKKKIDLLNPQRQLPIMFLPLLSAVGLVMLYLFVREKFPDLSKVISMEIIGYALILLSIVAFLDGIRTIYKVSATAIETNRLLESEEH